jgi:RHS repeat-associated protein
VSPGDTVNIKVFAKYTDDIADVDNVVPALASAIAGSFGNVSPVGETVKLVDAFSVALSAGAAVPNGDNQGLPKAYLQYILFNKNMTMAQNGHIMVDPAQKGSWQKMELEIPIEEIGYIYIYVANESMDNVDLPAGAGVYFDDMEVQLIDAPVTNASDYYPFGLAIAGRSYTSEKYRFGYQGQFAEMDDETGWNSFELRMYDPVIGRWMSTDPAGQFSSPYLSMSNNPVIGIDINGGVVFLVNFFDARASVGDGLGGTATLYASLAIDGKGNMAILYGGGIGISGTAGGAFTIGTSATVYYTADKISDICGIGFSFGFHNALARGLLSGGEYNIGLQIENDNSIIIHHGNTINPPLLADWGPNMGGGAIYGDFNWTIEAMSGDEIRNFLEDFLTQEQIGTLFQYVGERLDEYYKKPDLGKFNPDDLLIVPQDQTNRYKEFSHY